MPYDPRMLQMAQAGIGMMAPPPSPFDRTAPQQPQRPKQWWEQPMPRAPAQPGQSADPSQPNDPNAPKQPQPSLLQMLMLGSPATYSGTPKPGASGTSPWGWLGSLGQPPSAGGYR